MSRYIRTCLRLPVVVFLLSVLVLSQRKFLLVQMKLFNLQGRLLIQLRNVEICLQNVLLFFGCTLLFLVQLVNLFIRWSFVLF